MATLRSVWRVSKDVQIQSLTDNLFMFKFSTIRDKQRHLDGSLWTYDKQFLLLEEYDDKRPSSYLFKDAAFWIRVYGLPLNLMTKRVAERL